MRLSEVDITSLVEEHTQDYIQKADFSAMKRSLVGLKAIRPVCDSVSAILNEAHKGDKKRVEAEINERLCREQVVNDEAETREDARAGEEDGLQRGQFDSELKRINDQIRLCSSQEESHRSELREIGSRISLVKRAISAEEPSRIHVDFSSHHHHGHYGHGHHHGHSDSHVSPMIHVHADSAHLIQLREDRARLESERSSIQSSLDSVSTQRKQHVLRQQEIRKLLDVTIPNRERDRIARAHARELRAKARMGEDLGFEQLSQQRRVQRTREIQANHGTLRHRFTGLQTHTRDNSYYVFKRQLQNALHANDNTSFSFAERSALQQILQSIDEYFGAKLRERGALDELATATNALAAQNRELRQKETRATMLTASNPALANNNQQLAARVENLNTAIATHQARRRKLLYIGAIAGGVTIAAAVSAVLVMLFVTMATTLVPVLFVPAAIALVITAGLLIAALVMTYRNRRDNRQKEQCERTIRSNEAQIGKQTQELVTLGKIEIPELRTEIANSQQSITVIDRAIAQHVHHADSHLQKARAIEPVLASQSANVAMFSQPDTSQHAEPSAPSLPQDEDVFGFN